MTGVNDNYHVLTRLIFGNIISKVKVFNNTLIVIIVNPILP